MIFKMLTVLSTVLFLQSAHAHTLNQPEKCPSVAAVKSAGIGEDVRKLSNSKWAVIKHRNNYDTKDMWDFALFDLIAKDEAAAKAQAKEDLQSLIRVYGPTFHESKKVWVCDYYGERGEHAIAYNPPK